MYKKCIIYIKIYYTILADNRNYRIQQSTKDSVQQNSAKNATSQAHSTVQNTQQKDTGFTILV